MLVFWLFSVKMKNFDIYIKYCFVYWNYECQCNQVVFPVLVNYHLWFVITFTIRNILKMNSTCPCYANTSHHGLFEPVCSDYFEVCCKVNIAETDESSFLKLRLRLRLSILNLWDWDWDWELRNPIFETEIETETLEIPFLRLRLRLRPQNLTEIETEIEILLHNDSVSVWSVKH